MKNGVLKSLESETDIIKGTRNRQKDSYHIRMRGTLYIDITPKQERCIVKALTVEVVRHYHEKITGSNKHQAQESYKINNAWTKLG